ncbi:Sec-independent protein translocase subunit TatA/TatB [Sediminitomix flava]|uniref:Sec-independent protein translocase protein TatA n=1 Tax=Sediminitomix flava TaxID=379075 RepID=A0A315Z6V2_SEDFL|nr:twin-arginine translocase TatA/TatE family subunit [Sediminitomix flava]PWJ39261.1 sec-independent protein translocase protein TatA [Sediminitomix flava]
MEVLSILLFGMPGGWEMVLIFLAILLLFGAKRIPELARGLGRGIREFKDAKDQLNQELEGGLKKDDSKPKE